MDTKKKISEIYEKGFKKIGKSYQRQYPNEEFCRFMGRNFFHIKEDKRKKEILEEIEKLKKELDE